MVLDIHAHILPHAFLDLAHKGELPGVTLTPRLQGGEALAFHGLPHPFTPVFFDMDMQLAEMDAHGIDIQAISVAPRLFFYDVPADRATQLCRCWNDEILQRCKAYPSRFLPVCGLPMQDPAAAVEELLRLHRENVKMLQIGTTVNGLCLDEERFYPVYEAASACGMALLLHPLIGNADPQTKRYHLSNVAGNPYQTMAAAGNLIGCGILDRLPSLQFLLVHGGGALPYQIYRMDHAYAVRPRHTFRCQRQPSSYLRTNFWFDALVFDRAPLSLLRSVVGDDRICFGTDAPYDMTDYGQLERCESEALRRKIAYENGSILMGL